MIVSGHELEFFDCREIVGSGPEACSLLVGGRGVEGKRFDPSPLPYKTGILIPARRQGFFVSGYALCFVDLNTLSTKFVSKTLPYMKLVSISNKTAVVRTTTFSDDSVEVMIKD